MKPYRIIDTHCDTMSEILDAKEDFFDAPRHLNLTHMKTFQSYVQFFAAWIDENSSNWLSRALEIIDKFYIEQAKNPGELILITEANMLDEVLKQGKTGAILAIEDSRALAGKLANLRMLYRLGVRAICLAWNGNNDVTDGIFSSRGAGLTDFGREVVLEMNNLGMMVDVSHITVQGFWDVMELSKAPVMASHSNAIACASFRRNLNDEQIRALVKNHGYIGLNLCVDFLSDTGRAGIEDILRHIEHFLSLGAAKNIGLGSDFDGIPCLPDGMQNAADYSQLFEAMYKAGYKEEFLNDLAYKNAARYIKSVLK